MPIFAIHRHRRLWADPDRFDPDRFLPEHEATHMRTQFMPFGFGPRTCIGMSFAMIEATVLLATFVRARPLRLGRPPPARAGQPRHAAAQGRDAAGRQRALGAVSWIMFNVDSEDTPMADDRSG